MTRPLIEDVRAAMSHRRRPLDCYWGCSHAWPFEDAREEEEAQGWADRIFAGIATFEDLRSTELHAAIRRHRSLRARLHRWWVRNIVGPVYVDGEPTHPPRHP